MALDLAKFVCSSDLEGYFVDKLTGLPLAAGILTFYSDVDRTVKKSVYQLSDAAPYTMTALPNPLTLNSTGNYQDALGNNIVIYYLPFELDDVDDPASANDTRELYYVTVENSGNQEQFTRSAWPPLAVNIFPVVGDSNINNFIPNGQFLYHNNEPVTDNVTDPTIDILEIAQGGWSFQKTHGGTSTYTVTFNSEIDGASGLEDFPPFSVNIVSDGVGSETVHDLVIQWPDVNTFSVPGGVRNCNLLLAANLNTGSSASFAVILTSNYGAGGSTTVNTPLESITVTPGYSYYNITIPFPDNTSKNVGSGSYVAIRIRTPTSAVSVRFTDFALTDGIGNLTKFPTATNAEMLSEGVAGWMPTPNPDGFDLYLPLVLTPKGMTFDHSQIGDIVAKTTLIEFDNTSISTVSNELICDGSAYRVSDYSPLGIPYARLFNKMLDPASAICPWGNGVDFLNASTYGISLGGYLLLCTNKPGSQTVPANGAVSPGFTYAKAAGIGANVAGAATRDFRCYANRDGVVWGQCKTVGAPSTVAGIDATNASGATAGVISNTPQTKFTFTLILPDAIVLSNGAGIAGDYIDIYNTTVGYRFWFNVVGEIAPAAGGKTLVEVQLDQNMLDDSVAAVFANTVNAFQFNMIKCGNGASVAQSSYFTFQANGVTYTPWYNKDGGGTAPSVTNPLEVTITTGATAQEVAINTQVAINSVFFATPDYRGLFLRGNDPDQNWDNYSSDRATQIYNLLSIAPNTIEFGALSSHGHPNSTISGEDAAGGAGQFVRSTTTQDHTLALQIANFGIYETRPVNASVVWVIKY